MDIKILDSWLREYLKTKATYKQIANTLSLTSVSVERIEKFKDDHLFDIEITTNRPDLMSVIGLAREASAILPEFGIKADFLSPKLSAPKVERELPIKIENDPKLVNRICAVVMEVRMGESPTFIKDRLESSGIRTLNNLIDVTNYVMREIGHPCHVFDYDRLEKKTLIIRESKKGEKIVTLDKKEHTLPGGDIVADDGTGKIVDLLGVMGTANSIVTDATKRILFFLDNNDPTKIRKTSMGLAIRSEAAVLNEKGVDPELAWDALLRGIELYKEVADGKVASKIIDIYPNKVKPKTVIVTQEKVNKLIGINIPLKKALSFLAKLGFEGKIEGDRLEIKQGLASNLRLEIKQSLDSNLRLEVKIPSWRANDVEIPEDIVEEIARVYGYHKLPSTLPPTTTPTPYDMSSDKFYWEKRVKNSLKYFGFTEVYTYSMVAESLFEGTEEEAYKLKNPLTADHVFLRRTIVPSLLSVIKENPTHTEIKIFELANVYLKKTGNLPREELHLAGVIFQPKISFYEVKGIVEQLLLDQGIKNFKFKQLSKGGVGADVLIGKDLLGEIEILEKDLINFEFNFNVILNNASLKKVYKQLTKFPPIVEDLTLIVSKDATYEEIESFILKENKLIADVSLIGTYENTKKALAFKNYVYESKITFRIRYQDPTKNLMNEDVKPIREKLYNALEKEFDAKIA